MKSDGSRPCLDRGHEPGDVGGLVLQVAVHRDDDASTGTDDAGVHRRVLAEIALERHDPYARIRGMQPLEDGEGAVRGAVVDEDQLRGDARRLEGRHDAVVERLDGGLLVQDGHHHRHLRRGGSGGIRRAGQHGVRCHAAKGIRWPGADTQVTFATSAAGSPAAARGSGG